jgi:hypothetical protein
MPRFVVLASGFLLILAALISTSRMGFAAQDAAPAGGANHPVVGAWWSANDAEGPGVNTAYVVFHGDGTYLEVDPNIGVGVGAWRPTGDRSAELTYVFQDIDPEPNATAPGTVIVRQAVDVDETGNAFVAPLTVEVRLPDGMVVFTAAYTARGERLEIEPMGPLGTPVAATPGP